MSPVQAVVGFNSLLQRVKEGSASKQRESNIADQVNNSLHHPEIVKAKQSVQSNQIWKNKSGSVGIKGNSIRAGSKDGTLTTDLTNE